MLKIKDDVDLKELEKFGFKPKYNEDTGKITEMYRICGDYKGTTITMDENFKSDRKYKNFWHIFAWNRRITDHGYVSLTIDDYEILYDLIQARISRKDRGGINYMEILKEILFWWMLIDNILLCISKKWRQHTIEMLSREK